MGALRIIALLTLASCAEISGLSQLSLDGGPLDDAPSADVDVNDASPSLDAPSDSPLSGDGTVSGGCKSLGKVPMFCADFDEQDVTTAYVNGAIGSWSNVSQALPTFDTNDYTSSPNSAAFAGGTGEFLAYAAQSAFSSSSTFGLNLNVRVDTMPSTGDDLVLSVQVSSTYTLNVTLRASGQGSYSIQLNEVVSNDAGSQTFPHKPPGIAALATWEAVELTMTTSGVAITFGPSIAFNFPRAQTGIGQFGMTVGWSQTGWNGEVDDVVLTTN